MKIKILEALRTKFPGVSDSILGRIADKLAKTVTKEEEVSTAVEGVTFQSVLESYGDSRANEAQQTAVKNYEAKHNLKDGVKVGGEQIGSDKDQTKKETDQDDKEPTEQPKDDTPEWAKALIEQNKKLTERLDRYEKDNVLKSRHSQIAEVVKDLNENMQKPYLRTQVEGLSDDEFNSLLGEINQEVEGIKNESKSKGMSFGIPKQNRQSASSNELTKEQLSSITHREGTAVKNDEQPF